VAVAVGSISAVLWLWGPPPVSLRGSVSSPPQAELGFSLSKSHYQSLSHYQTKLNIYKAPEGRVHVFLILVYSLEERRPHAGCKRLWTGARQHRGSLHRSAALDEMQPGTQKELTDIGK